MTDALVIDNISKSFGAVRALDGVSFDVPAGSTFGLLGPNGAGKTTLFSIVANLLRPNTGSVTALGVDVRRLPELEGKMTLLPQDAQFERNVPILEQMIFLARLSGLEKKDAEGDVRRVLELVGLAEAADRGAFTLSHGMFKRLGIAQALLGKPELILLDEPTSGLDPHSARNIRDLIRGLKESATVVVSSHNLAEVQEICDHFAILDKGKVVKSGSVQDVTGHSQSLSFRVSRALTEEEDGKIKDLPHVTSIKRESAEEYTLVFDAVSNASAIDEITASLLRLLLDAGATPRELSQGRNLEDLFLEVTNRD